MTASRLDRRRPRTGWRGLPWLIALCLLVRSSVPLLAAAAAEMRGVGVGEVCPVYGVTLAPSSSLHMAHAGHGAMAAMGADTAGGDQPAGGGDRTAHGDDGAGDHVDPPHDSGAAGHASHGAQPGDLSHDHHDHHGNLAAAHDHCALAPLLGGAALAGGTAPSVAAVGQAGPQAAAPSSAVPLHDQALAWYTLGAHPPPG